MIKKYMWFIEWILASILAIIGIITIFEKTILLYMFSVMFIIFGCLRFINIFKNKSSNLLKWLLIVETILDVFSGGTILLLAIKNVEIGNIVGYIIGGVLYLRGFTHFLSISLETKKTNMIVFFTNMILLTLGTFVLSKKGMDINSLSWLFFGLMMMSTIILGFKGYNDFDKFKTDLISEAQNQVSTNVVNKDFEDNKENINNDETVLEEKQVEESTEDNFIDNDED